MLFAYHFQRSSVDVEEVHVGIEVREVERDSRGLGSECACLRADIGCHADGVRAGVCKLRFADDVVVVRGVGDGCAVFIPLVRAV